MICSYWICFQCLCIIHLIIIIEAKTSFYKISNIKFDSMKNGSDDIRFCNLNTKDTCINFINVTLSNKAITIQSWPTTIDLDTHGQLEIFAIVNYLKNSTVSEVSTVSKTMVQKQVILKFPEFTITVVLEIVCQSPYYGESCSDINMCQSFSSNVCRNNGECIPENNDITCKCTPGFKGNFCDELSDPCQGHMCSDHSTCESASDQRLKYRCRCQGGYSGVFCGEIDNTCLGHFCAHNSTCIVDKSQKLGYRCDCQHTRYQGRFCALSIDNCANNSHCSQYINATCISTKDSYLCYCDGGCKLLSDVTSTPDTMSLPFKWPFSELITFLFVVLEGLVIVTLIILIVFLQAGCCRPKEKRSKLYLDDNLVDINDNKPCRDTMEFGYNYGRHTPINQIDQEINPLYDMNEMQSFGNNQLLLDNSGMSTFGRR